MLNNVFIKNNAGLVTSRDKLIIQYNKDDVVNIINDFKNLEVLDIKEKYKLIDSRDWTIKGAKNDVIVTNCDEKNIKRINYRPIDYKFLYYTNKSKGFISYPRYDILRHLQSENIALISTKLLSSTSYNHCFLSKELVDKCTISNRGKETNYVFPLYLYPDNNEQQTIEETTERKPNLNSEIINQIAKKIGLRFVPEKNSPPLEGCLQDGVVTNEQQKPKIQINSTFGIIDKK